MFTPRLVIRDKRPLLRKVAAHLDQIASERGTVNVPDYQVCTEYVSRKTKGVASALTLALITFVSTAIYQTVYPTHDSEPYTIKAELPYKHDPAPSYEPFAEHQNPQHKQGTIYTASLATSGNRKQELQCLAKNIYFEARSESLRGRLAVGIVTLNRVEDQRYPDTICDVVWQDKQFSWTHDGITDKPNPGRLWESSKEAARFLLSEGTVDHVVDFTDNATHYHANYVSPYWNKVYLKTAEIGAHLFYRPENDNT